MTTTSVETKRELLERLSALEDDLRRLGLKRLGVFGSFVRDQQKASSDVDVLIEFLPGMKGYDRFLEIAFLLEDRLGRSVELVTTDSLSPYMGPRILAEVEDVFAA